MQLVKRRDNVSQETSGLPDMPASRMDANALPYARETTFQSRVGQNQRVKPNVVGKARWWARVPTGSAVEIPQVAARIERSGRMGREKQKGGALRRPSLELTTRLV